MNSDDVYFRNRLAKLEDKLNRLSPPSEGASVQLVQTTMKDTYPTNPSRFFAVHPLSIDGLAAEGESATLTADTDRTFYAYNLGSSLPPNGTRLLVTTCGGRNVFRYDG